MVSLNHKSDPDIGIASCVYQPNITVNDEYLLERYAHLTECLRAFLAELDINSRYIEGAHSDYDSMESTIEHEGVDLVIILARTVEGHKQIHEAIKELIIERKKPMVLLMTLDETDPRDWYDNDMLTSVADDHDYPYSQQQLAAYSSLVLQLQDIVHPQNRIFHGGDILKGVIERTLNVRKQLEVLQGKY